MRKLAEGERIILFIFIMFFALFVFYNIYENNKLISLDEFTESKIYVKILGNVNTPSTLELDNGTTLEYAINMCGGLTEYGVMPEGKDRLLKSGEQIYVDNIDTANTVKLDLNTVTLEQLMQFKGIGKVTAQKIIDYRNENGSFYNIDQLDLVEGIGQKTIESLRPYIK